jgi:DNA-binding NtrC family response regulator
MSQQPAHVLLIDDDEGLREVIAFQLEGAGYRVTAEPGGPEGLAAFDRDPPDVVLTDLKMPGMDGMAVLEAIRRRSPSTPVLVVTAFGTVETAVGAMRAGAHDYVTKPFSKEALLLKVERAAVHGRLLVENRQLKQRLDASASRPFLVLSEPMRRLMEQVEQVARSDLPVLLGGESGTGKELVARELHRLSDRASRPFVAVNCAAIPAELLEAELFGHEKGAFTGAVARREGRFAAADGGTLLLDEVGDMPLALQPKLLRVLQERTFEPVGSSRSRPVDVRVVAATHRELAGRLADGSFREDLYYRLAVVPLRVPPLREQPEAIGPLFDLFCTTEARRAGRSLAIDPAVHAELARRPWPGNVRQLENVARRTALLARGPTVLPSDLAPVAEVLAVAPADAVDLAGARVVLPEGGIDLNEVERAIVVEALRRCDGNKAAAARFLGIPRHVLVYRIEKYEL